ncbi:HU family DNA-binding protein [Porphyromonas endodontalis]|uniref:Putative DNA-binding protein n=1 Tax=Porphyromonas endodontalis (strain ATCC 35406 / DSM 24491 / JCM 8526 / CCUG 16442 / BCRC 14492 / NCTC 13058 / HG 370) TaxID=553175 RepID=C3JA91_POREA|nr:HU family DNA-binding protein [Porphyromonas endodontalis]EEN82882.1 putative DNA-binding protein [Porphyromonas endodontalis ATCC 35406]UBH64095.1 HU family DNA-binding protein [Porphyromonas endodontalis]SUB67637.1 putative DNA-binding protein [Porphyromonas endodontalis]
MIKIKAVERQVGFGKDEKKKRWFPAIYLSSDVTFEEFIDKVADETTISSADVKAVFDRAGKVLVEQLREGKSVDCGDLGTFRPSLTTKTGTGAETAEGVTMEMIDKLKVIYTPRVRVKDALKKGLQKEAHPRWYNPHTWWHNSQPRWYNSHAQSRRRERVTPGKITLNSF